MNAILCECRASRSQALMMLCLSDVYRTVCIMKCYRTPCRFIYCKVVRTYIYTVVVYSSYTIAINKQFYYYPGTQSLQLATTCACVYAPVPLIREMFYIFFIIYIATNTKCYEVVSCIYSHEKQPIYQLLRVFDIERFHV